MAVILWRSALASRVPTPGGAKALHHRLEAFLLECLSPFEMAHRGAREANQALRHLEERREEQARSIARELHDEAAQLLAAAQPSLEAMRSHLAPEGVPHLMRAIEVLEKAGDDFGLLPALRLLAEGVGQRAGLVIQVMGTLEERLPQRVETALYRVAQEGLNNIVRHARASHATVEVARTPAEVVVSIRDDGRGYDPAAPPGRPGDRGFGLEGIRERVAPLGGALEIWSRPGAGTELQIRVPLEVAYAHAGADRG